VRLIAAAIAALMFLMLPGAALPDEMPNVTDPELIQAGRKLFVERHCAYCHGSDGNGGVKLAARDDLEPISVFESIADGRIRGNLRMPAWRGVLSDEEIWQATAYVLALSHASK
jgi:mono/diheme cytochrome c family protein